MSISDSYETDLSINILIQCLLFNCETQPLLCLVTFPIFLHFLYKFYFLFKFVNFRYSVLFNLNKNSLRSVLPSCHLQGSLGNQQLTDLPKVTQRGYSRARIWTEQIASVFLCDTSSPFSLCYMALTSLMYLQRDGT